MADLPHIKDCIEHSETFVAHAKSVYDKVNAGQDPLEDAFIDEVVKVSEEVDALLTTCQLDAAETKWNSLLPAACIESVGILAHDGHKLRDDQSKPIAFARDLLKFKADY